VSSVALGAHRESVPYAVGHGEHGALQAVTEYAKTIDELARRIEDVLAALRGCETVERSSDVSAGHAALSLQP
jgi:hypothetical protein